MARDDVPHTVLYQWTIRELAGLLDCEPTPDAVHAARRARGVEALAREVVERGNFKTWLIDTGYGADTTFSLDELRAIVPCRIEEILRLEPMIERLIIEATDFDGLPRRVPGVARRPAGPRHRRPQVGHRVPDRAARRARRPRGRRGGLRRRPRGARGGTAGCASSRSPCSTTWSSSPSRKSARQGVPIQFHTGLGDPDLDLTLVDPAALRVLFSDRFRAAPIVLLHTGYPYVRSLAYLAAMFPNVYADMGEAILFAAGEATEITRELLGLAPASKILFSTDASLVPELYWVGARLGRRALGRVLDEHVADGALDERTALDWAERILWRNSERVYGL